MPEIYAELHCHSCFSLLDGATEPEVLVRRAVELGIPALALTDHNGVYGAVRMFRACQKAGIHPVLGAELDIYERTRLLLLAENRQGWGNLCWLITQAQQHGGKGQAILPSALLNKERCCGLIALYGGSDPQELAWLSELVAPGSLYQQVQRHLLPDDDREVAKRVRLARDQGIPLVATNDVHYAMREGHRLQDVLVAIRHNLTMDEVRPYLRANSEYYLKSPAEMAELFADLPEALANTLRIAQRCQVEIAFRSQALPPQPQLQGKDPDAFLAELCAAALPGHYPPRGLPKASAQVQHELDVIRQTRLAGFFLLVWEIVSWSRQQGIMVRGRGSAANSIVTYLLGITTVDPLEHNLLFERFLTPDSQSMPDIDLDFCSKRREEVIQYVYTTFGAAHTAMVCNYITYQRRSAIRDVGKALGIPADILDGLAKQGFKPGTNANLEDGPKQVLPASIPGYTWEHFETLCQEIQGFPRHLSIHVGGMIITACPLNELVPLEPATMPGRVVVQWDKDNVEDAGLIKLDLLSLRTFTAIDECLQLVQQTTGRRPNIDTLPLDDPVVYNDLCAGDTIGAFQVESRAQMQGLAQMQPRCFRDLVIEVALIRPGPLQGGMVHPFYRRKQGREPVTFPHPLLASALGDTLGVIVFQEQVMQVAMAVGGLNANEAARLRRAISKSRSTDEMLALQQRFMDGARQREVPQELAAELFERMIAFASKYGFCRSHAAAFAKTAYDSLWLRHYYPAAYYCSVLNAEPMG
ncbi:MAG: DNA polymerase III subunit alpha, partial [Anaerolineae bacterium]